MTSMTSTPNEFGERRRALASRFPTWTPKSLGSFLTDTAAEFGDRPLVITDDRTVTYAEVDAWATRLADGLASIGIQPGDRVGIVMANYLEFIPLKFAVARVGAVAIPFNYLYQRDELAYVLAQSECHALITMTSFGGLDQLAMLDDICPGWECSGGGDTFPYLRHVVQYSTDGHSREGVMTVDELNAAGAGAPGGADDSSVSPDDNGDILYTSGTTGSPKGVMVTHDAMQRTAYSSALTRAFQDGRRILFSLPCYHMFGYVEGLLGAMFVGGAIIPRTAFSATDYLASIERHKASDILAVPTMAIALVEHPDRLTRDLSSCTAILSGAAPAPVWLWEKMRDDLGIDEVTTGYGMTECGGAMTMTLPEDSMNTHSTTVGVPKVAGVAGTEESGDLLCVYKTVDPTNGEDLADGKEGELASRGPTHMLGFWNKPIETAEAMRDGWVLSGDLGRIDERGYLQLSGRSKELYKSGGELVMPKEVEELFSKQPGVSQAFAIGVPDDRWGEVGCVYVVAEDGADLDADRLMTVCRENLARFKVPKHVLFVDAANLPTTPTGKVQKFRLVARAVAELAAD